MLKSDIEQGLKICWTLTIYCGKTIGFLRKKSIGKCELGFLLYISPTKNAHLLTLENN